MDQQSRQYASIGLLGGPGAECEICAGSDPPGSRHRRYAARTATGPGSSRTTGGCIQSLPSARMIDGGKRLRTNAHLEGGFNVEKLSIHHVAQGEGASTDGAGDVRGCARRIGRWVGRIRYGAQQDVRTGDEVIVQRG